MDAELQRLAYDGANLVVRAVAADSWPAIKSGLARLFKRTGQPSSAIETRLDTARNELADASAQQLKEAEDAWRSRFSAALLDFPELADELRALVTEGKELLPPVTHSSVDQKVDVRDQGQAYVAARDLHVGGTPPRRSEPL